MKLAYVYDRSGKRMLYQEGMPRCFPSFLWFVVYEDEWGWRAHFLAFLNAVTEDLKFKSYQGVLSWGHYKGRWFFEFTPQDIPVPLWPPSQLFAHLKEWWHARRAEG